MSEDKYVGVRYEYDHYIINNRTNTTRLGAQTARQRHLQTQTRAPYKQRGAIRGVKYQNIIHCTFNSTRSAIDHAPPFILRGSIFITQLLSSSTPDTPTFHHHTLFLHQNQSKIYHQ